MKDGWSKFCISSLSRYFENSEEVKREEKQLLVF